MDYSDMFRIANLVAALLMVLGGICQFFPTDKKEGIYSFVVTGIYVIVFGLATAALEFQIPPQFFRYASFFFSFIGRGLFYVLVGHLIMRGTFTEICGFALVAIGAAYAVLEFIPSVEPPANMRDADAGWGSETV